MFNIFKKIFSGFRKTYTEEEILYWENEIKKAPPGGITEIPNGILPLLFKRNNLG